MKHSIKKLDDCKVELSVALDADVWQEAQKKAFRKQASKITIPGFRPGKAPEAMLRARVDGNRVINDAIQDCLTPAYSEAIRAEKVNPFDRPSVEVTKVSDTELELKFTVTTFPEVELGQYKDLHAEREVASVTDEEVDEAIQNRLKGAASLVSVEREAKLGDTVVIDFEGFVDGVAFDGGKADKYSLELGSNSFVPGFEDALVGVKAGDDKDVEITFPTQYVAELAGKAAVFKTHVHEVKEKQIPELDDEAVLDMGIKDVKTVDELKAHEKESILQRKVNETERKYYADIIDQIVKGSKVTMSSSIIESEAAQKQDQLKAQIEQNGLTFQQYLEITGQTEDELFEKTKEEAKANLTQFLVLEQISAKERLFVDDAELDHEIAKLADTHKMKVEDVRKALGNIENFRNNLHQNKLHEFLIKNNH
ncbi:MAG: trigger factor [Bacilli bacterium]|nr:trigger factor [Bacilli bacterium]